MSSLIDLIPKELQKKILKYSYFFLLYPFLILSIEIKKDTEISFAPERLIFFYILLYFLAYFINNRTIKSLYIRFIYLISLILTFVELGYISIYKDRMTPSTVFILLETNSLEVKEYLKEYLSLDIIIWFLILFTPSFFILKSVNKLIKQYKFSEVINTIKSDLIQLFNNKLFINLNQYLKTISLTYWKKTIFGIFILSVGITIYIKANHYKFNPIYQLYTGYKNYTLEKEKFNTFLSKKDIDNDLLNSVKSNNNPNQKETYVLIIGESTTRNHLRIYNYYRNTTPELTKLKNELVIFKNVISPHTHTIPSLGEVLTFGNNVNPQAKYKGSIIQLMKNAGFKTYWISNQVPIGINETMVAMIAKTADYTHFTNLGGTKELYSLDERILPYLKIALKDTSAKKFIVLHLLGTHTQYKNRYPKKFEVFKDTPPTNFPSRKALTTINQYDNAILYNDFIVAEIIKTLKLNCKKTEKCMAIYLSDHGEDVFETVNFTGHSESIGSKPMFQIPFIYWSNQSSDIKKFEHLANQKYMTDNLIYSLADITKISFDGMTKKYSIFSDSLQQKPRLIKNNIDYDELFK